MLLDIHNRRSPHKQQGAVLVLVLIFLMALTLISFASITDSNMGLRMASNTEEQVNAFQTAQAAVEAVIADPANLPTTGPLDTPTPVALAGDAFYVNGGAGESIAANAARQFDCGLPPRTSRGSSLVVYSSFGYRVASDVDRVATGRGRSSVRLGYVMLGPKC